MNLFQLAAHYLFGFQYVVLVLIGGDRPVRRAYILGDKVYANPYLPQTRCELLPEGKVNGKFYVLRWEPVTNKSFDLYNRAGQLTGN